MFILVMTKYFVITALKDEHLCEDIEDEEARKAAEKGVGEAAATAATRFIVARSHSEQLRVTSDCSTLPYFISNQNAHE
jgi:hypothetical protein